mmetsp:Transcript_20829/g.63733  ORF Transcript_20829/g.63733 Transcript_20829/m.63733 type:complete len:211 (+) Transcript_20829:264-896(+)
MLHFMCGKSSPGLIEPIEGRELATEFHLDPMNHAKGRVARGRGKELINKQAACRISNVVVGASYTQLPSLGHFGSIRECLLELEASFDVPAAQVMSIILKDLELQVCDDRRDLCACHDGAEYALKVTAPTNHQRRWQSHSYVSTPNPLDSRVVPSIVRVYKCHPTKEARLGSIISQQLQLIERRHRLVIFRGVSQDCHGYIRVSERSLEC